MQTIRTGKNVVFYGEISFGDNCSVWHNAVLRADTAPITVQDGTNIQDLVMIHAGDGYPVSLGKNVTIGHSAILHGCTIKDHTLIGMGAIIMNGAVIESDCIVAAGALVTERKHFPARTLIMGHPAKAVRKLTAEEIDSCQKSAVHYQNMAEEELSLCTFEK